MAITGAVSTALRQDAPYQAEIAMGAQLIMDFQGARSSRRPYYWYRGTRYTSPEKIPGWSFSRNSVGYAEDSFGNLIQFPANVPRITDRGLLVEEQRTNGAANNLMVGAASGSPGTMPTGWTLSGPAPASFGLTQTIVTGSTDGVPFFEVTLTGTPSGSGGVGFYFTGSHVNNPMSAGQVWTASAYLQVIGTPVGLARMDVGIVQRNSGGANTGGGSAQVTPLPATRTRFPYTHTITDATTVGGQANVTVAFSAGVPLAVTYRIWLPQFEQGSYVSTPVPTSGAAGTRFADNAAVGGLGVALAGPATLSASAYLPAADSVTRDLLSASAASTGSNSARVSRGAANTAVLSIASGGVAQSIPTLGGFVGAMTLKLAGGINSAAAAIAANGNKAPDAAITLPVGMDTLHIGSNRNVTAWTGGYIQTAMVLAETNGAQLQRLAA